MAGVSRDGHARRRPEELQLIHAAFIKGLESRFPTASSELDDEVNVDLLRCQTWVFADPTQDADDGQDRELAERLKLAELLKKGGTTSTATVASWLRLSTTGSKPSRNTMNRGT